MNKIAGVKAFRGKFQARVWIKGRAVHLGTFAAESEAVSAVHVARLEHGLSEHRIPSEVRDQVAELYRSGKSKITIASRLNISANAVLLILKEKGISRRPLGAVNRGSRCVRWKGDDASYSAFHNRLYRLRGKPKHCEQCGLSDPSKWYDWANLTGQYSDPNDYKRLCRPCHRRLDAQRRTAA